MVIAAIAITTAAVTAAAATITITTTAAVTITITTAAAVTPAAATITITTTAAITTKVWDDYTRSEPDAGCVAIIFEGMQRDFSPTPKWDHILHQVSQGLELCLPYSCNMVCLCSQYVFNAYV